MRILLVPCLALLLGACTPAIREYGADLKRDVQAYDYNQVWDFFTSYQAPNNYQKEENQLKQLCMHPDSERRMASMNGINDEVWYTRCTLSAYPNHQPQRLDGRPRLIEDPEEWVGELNTLSPKDQATLSQP